MRREEIAYYSDLKEKLYKEVVNLEVRLQTENNPLMKTEVSILLRKIRFSLTATNEILTLIGGDE